MSIRTKAVRGTLSVNTTFVATPRRVWYLTELRALKGHSDHQTGGAVLAWSNNLEIHKYQS